MKLVATVAGEQHEVQVDGAGADQEIALNGVRQNVELRQVGTSHFYSLLVNNCSFRLHIEEASNGCHVSLNGKSYFVELEDEKTRQIRRIIKVADKPKGEVQIKAPMPGLIVKINVKVGQQVKVGDGLLIIEAMKMENEIRCQVEGTVKKLFKSERDSVEKDALLMLVE